VKGYDSDIKKSGLLDEWKVKIELENGALPVDAQPFNKSSLLITFPVSPAKIIKLYCVPEFLGDFLIWPHQVTAPLQSSLVELEVKRVSDFLRIFVESDKQGITSMLVRNRWKEASDIYEDVTNMLLDAKLQKIVTAASIYFEGFIFRDDILENFVRQIPVCARGDLMVWRLTRRLKKPPAKHTNRRE
jgi:hypothetical protein